MSSFGTPKYRFWTHECEKRTRNECEWRSYQEGVILGLFGGGHILRDQNLGRRSASSHRASGQSAGSLHQFDALKPELVVEGWRDRPGAVCIGARRGQRPSEIAPAQMLKTKVTCLAENGLKFSLVSRTLVESNRGLDGNRGCPYFARGAAGRTGANLGNCD